MVLLRPVDNHGKPWQKSHKKSHKTRFCRGLYPVSNKSYALSWNACWFEAVLPGLGTLGAVLTMHSFTELIRSMVYSAINKLDQSDTYALDCLKTGAETTPIKILQQNNLHRAVLAVGIFSLFEARLQNELDCKDGFLGLTQILKKCNQQSLLKRFELFKSAINVLKHGRGPSYDELLRQKELIPFKVKRSELFFNEGDIAEILMLIDVDDQFIVDCVDLVINLSKVINNSRDTFL
jgi:hypothetical protein